MSTSRRFEWLAPVLLIALGIVPSVAGTARLAELAGGGAVTEANARFFAAPLPVILHVLAAIPFALVGALLFAPAFRRRWPRGHRRTGEVLAPLGVVAAVTGLWMAHFYPWPEGDGLLLYWLRIFFGAAMLFSILAGVRSIRRKDLEAHGEWMRRGYAIGMGAGTQVFTHLPWFIFVGQPSEFPRAVMMGAGWAINWAVAEALIRRARRSRSGMRGSSGGAVAKSRFPSVPGFGRPASGLGT